MKSGKYFVRVVLLTVLAVSTSLGDDAKEAVQPVPSSPEAELATQQTRLATRLAQLQDLFADLRQFEEDVNPRRAELLEQAVKQAGEPRRNMTKVIEHLSRQDLRKALAGQDLTIQQLEALLALLKQEDRGERIKSERQRIKEYIKEIEVLRRIQRALRGQNEGGLDEDRLAKGQEGVADRTEKLDNQIKEDEGVGGGSGDPSDSSGDTEGKSKGASEGDSKGKSEGDSKGKSEGDSKGDSEGDSKGKSEGDSKGDSEGDSKGDSEGDSKGDSEGESKGDSEGDSKGKSEGDSKGDSEGDSKGDSEGESKGDSEGDSKGDSEGDSKGKSEGDSKGDSEGDSKGDSEGDSKGDSQGDSKGDSQGDSQGNSQGGGESQPQPQSEQNPVRKRIQAAEEKMREAKRKLEEANRGDSIEAQREAERQLELAQKELEEILRQLREEEVERMLAMLEGRFRRMLEREIKVHESTLRLDKVPAEQRNSEFDISTGKLSFEQKSIAAEADRALVLLLDDGSSIAFPETVEQMSDDMKQVANRLVRAQVGTITQAIEEDIIATLEDLIQALVKAQQDLEDQPPSDGPPPPPGPPQDQPLVDVIAELKMIRGLQDRVYRRHERYAQRLLENPDDPIGQTTDPELQRAIGRLADREQKIKQITRDIVLGKNR